MPTVTEKRTPLKQEKPNYVAYWFIVAVVALVLVICIRSWIVKGYVVNTDCMSETLQKGDFVLVEEISKNKPPEIGDVVAFRYPAEPSQYRFGRVVAAGGSTVQIIQKKLYIDGDPVKDYPGVRHTDPLMRDELYSLRDNFGPYWITNGCYFIMGDNRDYSVDSRFWGELRQSDILGRPLFIYFAWVPDPHAPEVNSILDVPKVVFYNVGHFLNRFGFSRVGKVVR